jgi:ATP-dependent Lhr-like helicase
VSATLEIVTVSAADPLNLAGIVAAGEKVPANSGRSITFRDGVIVASEESRTVLKATG